MNESAKILVVDDDPNLRKTLADILSFKGYVAIAAANGAEAVAAVLNEKISLALIDLILPDISGLDVMERIKELSPLTEAISRHHFDQVGRLTVSFGVTEFEAEDAVESLLKRVTACLPNGKAIAALSNWRWVKRRNRCLTSVL